ncbi:MAG: hypothetical protein RJA44_991 [Pseudomonadota bacterium]|jgi:mono/diheme cytochrome c family protein
MKTIRMSGVLLLMALGLTGGSAVAAWPHADLALGERLLAQHQCAECHARRVGGDGSAIYRPNGRISTPAALQSMVQYCSTQLDLALFPDEVDAIAAVLARDHYRFPR